MPAARPKLVISGSSAPGGGSWAAAQLEVGDILVYLCEAQGISATEVKKPGFVVYDSAPMDEFHDRIRRCLSFLGARTWLTWVSRFDEEWHLTDFEVVSPYISPHINEQGGSFPLQHPAHFPQGPYGFAEVLECSAAYN